MRAYRGVQTELELFLNSAPDRDEWSPLRAFALPTGKEAPLPVEQAAMWAPEPVSTR
jgi:hypothetical protein